MAINICAVINSGGHIGIICAGHAVRAILWAAVPARRASRHGFIRRLGLPPQLYALLDDKVADAEIRAARRRRGRSAS